MPALVVKIVQTGPQGPAGGGQGWGTITGTLSDQTDLQNELDALDTLITDLDTALGGKFDTDGGRGLSDFSEGGETLAFTPGPPDTATLDVSNCKNRQLITLTANGAITTTGTPVVGKGIILYVTHSVAPWTLSFNGTDLELEATAAGQTETVMIEWNGAAYIVNRGGVVDLTI